jgi:hypothetical protein
MPMSTKVAETTTARQVRRVFYEPDHAGDINDTIAGVLHLRGYRLTSDESWLASLGVHAMVTVEGDGSLTLHDGDLGAHLPDVEEFRSPKAYASAIADFLDGTTDDVVLPPPVYGNPRAEVDRVDAVQCGAWAMHQVGSRLVCEEHYSEVLHAYWEAIPGQVLSHFTDPHGMCGGFEGPVSR